MSTEIIQVRDVPADDAEILRARGGFPGHVVFDLREPIHDDTSRPVMIDVLTRIGAHSEVCAV